MRALDRFPHRLYDRHFARELLAQVAAHPQWRTHAFTDRPRGLRAFDEAFTAGYAGCSGAEAYYAGASALPWLARITLPTSILVAQDDPVVDHRPLLRARTGPGVVVTAPTYGGHLGFLGGNGPHGRRWMDAWVIAQVGR
ncbi:MAG: hypothetical protein H0W72_15050 [Planctomycetes bacterium]|nr:hypothetical protein [Planctomycetota bacterium]